MTVHSRPGKQMHFFRTATGTHKVVAYPPVLSGATLCYVSVVARVAGGKTAGAVVDY